MLLLVLGLVVFLGAHLVPASPGLRAGLATRLGETPYKGLFALVSLIGLVLIVIGYGQARAEGALVLWTPPKALVHLNLLLMLPVFPLLFAAYLPGRIRATLKHPMITAVKLWAFGHLLANGTLPDLLLFGGFLAWGVIDRISLKRRGAPVPAPVAGFTRNDAIAIVLGLVVYGLFVARLHLLLIGVSPLPSA
jgi:uncharacterized membrane protein